MYISGHKAAWLHVNSGSLSVTASNGHQQRCYSRQKTCFVSFFFILFLLKRLWHNDSVHCAGYCGYVTFTTPDLKVYADGQIVSVDEYNVNLYIQTPQQPAVQQSAYNAYTAYDNSYGQSHYPYGAYYGKCATDFVLQTLCMTCKPDLA